MDRRIRQRLQQHLTLSLAFLVLAAGWAEVWEGAPWWSALGVEPRVWWHLIPLLLMVGPVLLRTRRPVASLAAGFGITVLSLGIGLNIGILLCLTDLIYALGLRGSRRAVRRAEAAFAALILLGVLAAALAGEEGRSLLNLALIGVAILIVPLWWAKEVRLGHPLGEDEEVRRALEAERHAALLRREEEQRRAAVEKERRRMARELHDVISSQVSAMALTSGAVLNAEPDPQRDRRALQTVRRTSVETLGQLRDMMGLLRGDAAPEEGRPPGDHEEFTAAPAWEDVLATAQEQGLAVGVSGDLPAELPEAQHHVAVRVLQEALTNALRHGDGSAEVRVEARRRDLRLRITSGTAEGPLAQGSHRLGTGTGLIAMEERVQQAGGTLHAGPAEGAWRVEAVLPLSGRRSRERHG